MKISRSTRSEFHKGKSKSKLNNDISSGRPLLDASDRFEHETIDIIKRAKSGEIGAINELIERYKRQVAAIAYRIVGDHDEADDVAQMVFVKTAKNLSKFDTSKKFSTWLYRITVNATIDYMRKFRRHRYELLENYSESLENEDDNPEEILNRKKLRGIILKAAESLNDKQKTAFFLKDMEGHQIEEVSEIMNMPEATVRWYLHRARIRLRRELRLHFSGLLESLRPRGNLHGS